MRRRIPEAAAESRVRGAWASAELDGSRSSIGLVRDLMRGARPWSPDPDPGEEVLRAAVGATAATERYADLAPFSTRQVLAAQRALNKLNYGPIKPDGLFGPGTRQAIERFERDRKLPVTGEVSGRTARELAAASGIAMD